MKRIQRKRIKGWKMPENTIYVGRPTKWGNPFQDMQDMVYYYSERRAKLYIDPWVFLWHKSDPISAVSMFEKCVKSNEFIHLIKNKFEINEVDAEYLHLRFSIIANSLDELKGKDLACFCQLDKPCHADVLLKLSNTP